MVRFDANLGGANAAARVGAVEDPAATSASKAAALETGLGPVAPRPGLGAQEQLTLVDNLDAALQRLTGLLEVGDAGRADAMIRNLERQRGDLKAALQDVAFREDPDAGAALRALGRTVAGLEGRSEGLAAFLSDIGALPGISVGLRVGRAQQDVELAIGHAADFMKMGRPDLAQLADRFAGRRGPAPFYEVRAILREVEAHRGAGRAEFATRALDHLERTLDRLEGQKVAKLKSHPEDPDGGPPLRLPELRETLAALRADAPAAPDRPVVGHEALLESAVAFTADIPALVEQGRAAGQVYSAELKAALGRIRTELMADSPLSESQASFLAEAIQWDVPKVVQKKLQPVAAEVIRFTAGAGLASLHTITDEAPNPRAGYGGLDVGYMHQARDLWHEMFHHVEYALPDAFERAWSFLKSRATHEDPRPLVQLSPDMGFPPDLHGYDAPMIHPYAGVVKPDRRVSEVISVGGEHCSDAGAMTNLAVEDKLHLDFTLGVALLAQKS